MFLNLRGSCFGVSVSDKSGLTELVSCTWPAQALSPRVQQSSTSPTRHILISLHSILLLFRRQLLS